MKSLKQLIAICAIIIGALTANGAYAEGFSDEEQALANSLQTQTLDFSLLASFGFLPDPIAPNELSTRTISVMQNGTLPFQYNFSAAITGGDTAFCNALTLDASLGGTSYYNGNISGFTLVSPRTITGLQDDWLFALSFSSDDPALQDKTCSFSFTADAWQTDSDGTWGFTDTETIDNTISSGTWPTVVINEVMWMGSHESTADEWIELRNITSVDIDLTDWIIENAGTSASPNISLSGIIPANGFYLLSNYDSSASSIVDSITVDLVNTTIELTNAGEQLTLRDTNNNIIDQTPDPSLMDPPGWPAGYNGNNANPADPDLSMERNDIPGDGTLDVSWHVCVDNASLVYWDSGLTGNYGTPKAPNLSDNDPTALILLQLTVGDMYKGTDPEVVLPATNTTKFLP